MLTSTISKESESEIWQKNSIQNSEKGFSFGAENDSLNKDSKLNCKLPKTDLNEYYS